MEALSLLINTCPIALETQTMCRTQIDIKNLSRSNMFFVIGVGRSGGAPRMTPELPEFQTFWRRAGTPACVVRLSFCLIGPT